MLIERLDMYILNNGRISLDKNEYILFNSAKKNKTKLELYPHQAERARSRFGLEVITKTQAEQSGLNEWEEVKI